MGEAEMCDYQTQPHTTPTTHVPSAIVDLMLRLPYLLYPWRFLYVAFCFLPPFVSTGLLNPSIE
jgi:hypothetical protein